MNMNEEANYMINEIGCSEPFIGTDVHPLDAMAAHCEAGAGDPSGMDPEGIVDNHIMGSFLSLTGHSYGDASNKEVVVATKGTLRYKYNGASYHNHIVANFLCNSEKIEVEWYLMRTVGIHTTVSSKGNLFCEKWISIDELKEMLSAITKSQAANFELAIAKAARK